MFLFEGQIQKLKMAIDATSTLNLSGRGDVQGHPHTEKMIFSNGRGPITSRHSSEAETANQDIYDDFKLKKTLVSMLHTKICQRFNPLTAGAAYNRVFIFY